MKRLALFGLAGSFAYGRMRSRIIDLVYADTELNRYLIEKTKALTEVAFADLGVRWHLVLAFSVHGDILLFLIRPET